VNTIKRSRPVVAIDGPAGAGKSTVTRRVADRLGYTRVDTGALYRAVAWLVLERGVDLGHVAAIGALARELAQPGALGLGSSGENTRVTVLGHDVSSAIRTQGVALAASQTSQLPEVRDALLEMQRQLGRDGGVVLEGRDIGSVVFPDAEAKFFLTASSRVRAERRRAELLAAGSAPTLEQVQADVEERDRRDSMRAIAPLVRAPDAMEVDSSTLPIDEVVDVIVREVERVAALLRADQGR
jgi:cytidylate kinase